MPCHASHVPPMVPPVQGTRVGSCVTGCTKSFLKPIFRDFCPAGWEVAAACLAKDLAADRTWGIWGIVVMSAGFWVSPKPGADCGGGEQCKVGTFPWLPLLFRLCKGPSQRAFLISLAKPYPHSKRSG